ncbi:hypothetical protein MycrhDRAFT_6664 [Mycolicibacterium rhodesiae JS60]|nr:hypothetical protein MycrhDRAFT_6664 [Mycolicibacterium rhodesiae JS60]
MDATADEPMSLAEAAAKARSELPPFDPSLESLVMYINLLDTTEIGVTLHVKGIVVSGLLISGRSYFNLMVRDLEMDADRSADPASSSGARAFADFFRMSLERQERARDEYRSTEKLPPRPHHICLRQATSFTPTEPIRQSLWRGRLVEVDAWSLGYFGERIPPLPPEST